MISSFVKSLILFDIFIWAVLRIPVLRIVLVNLIVAIWFHRKFLKIAIQTLPRDIKGVKTLLAVESAIRRRLKEGSTIGTLFEGCVEKHPQKIAFVSIETGQKWTFAEFNQLTNQVANYFSAQGLKKGDVVALLANNCPEYVAFWLGLSKIGVVTALINYNLRAEPLGHSIRISNAKCLIMGSDFQKVVEEDTKKGYIDSSLKRYVFGGASAECLGAENIMNSLKNASKLSPIVKDLVDFKSVLIYIYTSGTTGLPKACVITHARFYMLAGGTGISLRVKPDDKLYVIMPLYHTAAGILGVGQTILNGCTSVVRKKFSSSRFWEECVEHQCTVSQYIGEICRYLLAQPYRPAEKQHKVRLMYGNGLRAQIWEDFVNRFNIEQIGEIYGSTEGNASLINLDSKVGACGFLPIYPYSSKRYPVRLVKVNPETGELIRDENGLCIRCRPGEHGEMVGRIIKGSPLKDFIGYVSEIDTNKKLVKDVFQKGDVAFCSGDILYMDEKGYVYFKDRTGDTFRWKGENVSTTEVEGVIQKVIGLNDATSYGVEIPGLEGRAGMVAIVDENQNTDLEALNKKIKEVLPSYARPVFLRLCREVETTGTYKLRKSDLQKASFDPKKCSNDKLFYLNSNTGHYEPLTNLIYEEICAENIKF